MSNSDTENKQFATMAAQFAIDGHCLQKLHRPDDKTTLFVVSRWGQSRVFTAWHDVQGFLNQVRGTK